MSEAKIVARTANGISPLGYGYESERKWVIKELLKTKASWCQQGSIKVQTTKMNNGLGHTRPDKARIECAPRSTRNNVLEWK